MQRNSSRRWFLQSTLFCVSALAAAELPAAKSSSQGFKLGIIADEITDDLARALEFIAARSLGYCELRELWHENIMNLTASELRRARELVNRYRLHVSEIASPIFKYHLPGVSAHPENPLLFHSTFTDRDSPWLLRRAFEIAHFFGTAKVRVFSFWRVARPQEAYTRVQDRLGVAAELAGRNGITLMLENEYDTMMNEIPYPDGYLQIKGLIAHMHIKDVRKTADGKLSWAPVGSGLIDWRGQLRALREEGYRGTMSLETHYRPSGDALATAEESLAGLMRIIHEIGQPDGR